MNCVDAIRARRSVRRFKEDEIPENVLDTVLDAGRLAPSAGNMQPWEFIVIRNKQRMQNIIEVTYVGSNPDNINKQKWISGAPVVIIICANFKRSCARYGEAGKRVALMDICGATENILIAATSLGLGACWVSGFNSEKLSNILKLPSMTEPISIVPLGYIEKHPGSPNKFDLGEVVHFEEYGIMEP